MSSFEDVNPLLQDYWYKNAPPMPFEEAKARLAKPRVPVGAISVERKKRRFNLDE